MNNSNGRCNMKIGVLLYPMGYHAAAWRDHDVSASAGVELQRYTEYARIAERGHLDFVFLADSLTAQGDDIAALSRTAIRYIAQFEPVTLLSALAAVTEKIGLVCSITTTYNAPYLVARQLASLDHISQGRAGWNVVTSKNEWEARQFGSERHPAHAVRYPRAHEFVEVVKGLWDTWEDDAFVRDKKSGMFFDPKKFHLLEHRGQHFQVRGPLNVPRPPQGYPVIFQAGSSEHGKNLAAACGEVVYTAQSDVLEAREFYHDVKRRMAGFGRHPDDLLILPGVFTFAGSSKAEADEKYEHLQSLIDPEVALFLLKGELGEIDLNRHPLDGPVPDLPPSNAGLSRQQLLVEFSRKHGMTLAQLAHYVAGSRGHLQLVGSAEMIADQLEEWVSTKAADGFMLMPPTLPGGLKDFVDIVVPELQRRGLFRRAYEGRTLREHLGIARPAHPLAGGGHAPGSSLRSGTA
jgi:FMN-dependent oxidoreductase (nitrilotriacetate monooxygenase family)